MSIKIFHPWPFQALTCPEADFEITQLDWINVSGLWVLAWLTKWSKPSIKVFISQCSPCKSLTHRGQRPWEQIQRSRPIFFLTSVLWVICQSSAILAVIRSKRGSNDDLMAHYATANSLLFPVNQNVSSVHSRWHCWC